MSISGPVKVTIDSFVHKLGTNGVTFAFYSRSNATPIRNLLYYPGHGGKDFLEFYVPENQIVTSSQFTANYGAFDASGYIQVDSSISGQPSFIQYDMTLTFSKMFVQRQGSDLRIRIWIESFRRNTSSGNFDPISN